MYSPDRLNPYRFGITPKPGHQVERLKNMIKKTKLKNNKIKVTFVLPGDHAYGKVFLVGDFNNWNHASHQFIKRVNNTYSVAVTIKKGSEYAFRYLAENGDWINDETADGYRVNEYGTENCLVCG